MGGGGPPTLQPPPAFPPPVVPDVLPAPPVQQVPDPVQQAQVQLQSGQPPLNCHILSKIFK